jgi:rhodanese-related sulfurtransferase
MNRRSWLTAALSFFAATLGLVSVGCGSDTPPPPPPVITSVSAQELMQLMNANAEVLVLDVRRPDEHAEGHVAGAVNIPHNEISARMSELEAYRDKHVIVCCWAGGRADIAKQTLREAGFTSILDLRGHMAEWERLGYPVERTNE